MTISKPQAVSFLIRLLGSLCLLAILSVKLLTAGPNGKITGTVIDKATGEPLPGVNVIVQGTHLGAATGADGGFLVFNVDAGIYDVKASAIGYQKLIKTRVLVLPDFTTRLHLELVEESLEMPTVIVVAERPMIQKDQTGSVHVTTSEEIRNLPIRGVYSTINLTAGVVENASKRGNNTHIRGGRVNEHGVYIDGFVQNDALNGNAFVEIANGAIEEVVVITGGFDAKYGQRISGLTQVVTKRGGTNLSGSLEYVTDRIAAVVPSTLAYNHDVLSVTLGGPLFTDRIRFFAGSEWTRQEDADPGIFGYPVVRFGDPTRECRDAYGSVVDCNSEFGVSENFVNCFDADGNVVPCVLEDQNGKYLGPNPASVGPGGFIETDEAGKPIFKKGPRPLNSNRNRVQAYNGKLTFIPSPAFRIDLNSVLSFRNRNRFGFSNSRLGGETYTFTPEHVPVDKRFTGNLGLTTAWMPNERSLIRFGVNFFTTKRRVRDRTKTPVEELTGTGPQFVAQNSQDGFDLYRAEGRFYSAFLQSESTNFTLRADGESQLFDHHYIKLGAEFQRHTLRYYFGGFSGSGGPLANNPNQYGYFADTSGGKWKLRDAEDYDANIAGRYSFVSSDLQFHPDLDGAKHPMLAFAYVQDKIEYEGFVLNAGLRVDYLNTGEGRLRNIYDPTGETNPDQQVHEDLNDNGLQDTDIWIDFNLDGFQQSNEIIKERWLAGSIGPEDYTNKNHVDLAISPRLSLSLPVTDKTLFRVSYGRFFQIPDFDMLYTGSDLLEAASLGRLGGAARVGNQDLNMAEAQEYEIGGTHILTPILKFDLTAYYKDVKNLVNLQLFESKPTALILANNLDQAVIKGVDVVLEMRRTGHFAGRISYGVAYAEGTGSENDGNFQNAWLDFETAKITSRLDFDQRHTMTVIADLRTGENDGWQFGEFRPFENTGINLLVTGGTGFPYTPTTIGAIRLGGLVPHGEAIAPINSQHGPWQIRVDLKATRTFLLLAGLSVTTYLQVKNLFNDRIPVNVYPATGSSYDDGWLASHGGQTNIETHGDVYLGQYLSRLKNNFFFQAPRQVFGGIILEF